jgi:hypothetical protein
MIFLLEVQMGFCRIQPPPLWFSVFGGIKPFVFLEEMNLFCPFCVFGGNLTHPFKSSFIYFLFFEHLIPSFNHLALVHELIVWGGYKHVTTCPCACIRAFVPYLAYL